MDFENTYVGSRDNQINWWFILEKMMNTKLSTGGWSSIDKDPFLLFFFR